MFTILEVYRQAILNDVQLELKYSTESKKFEGFVQLDMKKDDFCFKRIFPFVELEKLNEDGMFELMIYQDLIKFLKDYVEHDKARYFE